MKQLRLSIYCFLNNIQTHRQTATTWFLYTCVGTLLSSNCAWASIVSCTISKHTDKRLLLGSCIPAWALCCQATAPEHPSFPVQYPDTQTNGYNMVPAYLCGELNDQPLVLCLQAAQLFAQQLCLPLWLSKCTHIGLCHAIVCSAPVPHTVTKSYFA